VFRSLTRAVGILLAAIACILLSTIARPARAAAQDSSNPSQWLTWGHNPQRTGVTDEERTFTTGNVGRLGLAWHVQVPNEPLSLNGLTAPLVVANVATKAGTRSLVIVAGSSNHLFALDAADGSIVWKADFPVFGKPQYPSMWLCPNALNDTPVVDPAHGRIFVIAADGRLHTVALADGRELQPPLVFVQPYAKMWSLNYSGGILYTSVSQDCNEAHSGVFAMNPDQPGHPVTTFWSGEPKANAGNEGFFGAGIWGRGGPSVDFDGYVYGATGDAPFAPDANEFGDTVLRLAPASLDLAGYYTPSDWKYITTNDLDMATTTPVIFRWKSRILTATGGKGCIVYLADTRTMQSSDHHAPAYASPRLCNDEQTFQMNGIWGAITVGHEGRGHFGAGDAHGDADWLYVPIWGPASKQVPAFPKSWGPAPRGSIMAFKLTGSADKPALEPQWVSSDIAVPEPAVFANGLLFVLGTGENTQQVMNGNIHRIIGRREAEKAATAVLHVLDARTGRELWTSGGAINDWTHFSGLAVAQGKIFVVTHSGGVWAFGLK
jgi:outer membrane protein assembly factor BamB